MNERRIKRLSAKPDRPLRGRADLARVRAMRESEIEATSPPELVDLPADFWDHAQLVIPVPKTAISLRLDEDVLAWFRAQGPKYQSRMNAVLRTYMTYARRRRKRAGAA